MRLTVGCEELSDFAAAETDPVLVTSTRASSCSKVMSASSRGPTRPHSHLPRDWSITPWNVPRFSMTSFA
jgi:hypothetical protein